MRARVILVVMALCAGCSNKLSSDISLNGEKLKLSSCRNGVSFGFRGVELTTDNGTRIRIAATQTGAGDVAVMPAGSTQGTRIGACGSFEISDQSSTVNDVRNVEGRATLDCSSAGFALKGTVSFSNCH